MQSANYFKDCKTLEEVKKLYRQLAMANHPDKGGDLETMQKINNDYAYTIAHIVEQGNYTEERAEREMNASQAYKDAIDKIIHLDGIIIELCGFWIWVTGNTKPHKDALKAAGYFWAHKKAAWYFRTEEYKVKSRYKMSLDQIRKKYGSQTVQGKNRDELAA